MSDFLTADIDELLEDAPAPEERDINEMLAEADRELMSFKPLPKKQEWPEPIRKRICIK